MQFSIVIPCYNEAKNIPLVLDRFKEHIDRSDLEVILVNNGSQDDSAEILKGSLPKYPFARSIEIKVNQGYGQGILAGLSSAKGRFIGWTHADLQADPADVIKAFELIAEQKDPENSYVKGLRRNRSLFDSFFTWGMSVFESFYLGHLLRDINAQPNIFSRKFFESWRSPPQDFSLDLYALYQAKKSSLKIIRFPVSFPRRIHGRSSWNTGLQAKWRFIERTVKFSKTLKKDLKK